MGILRRGGQMSDSALTAAVMVLSGGLQDAYTYFCRGGVFANAQTGNIVLLGTGVFSGDLHGAMRYLVPIAAFLLGIIAAELVRRRCRHFERVHWRQLVVLAELALLLGVGFMPQRLNMAANAAVSFVCAMQVQAFRKVRGHAYASTMCIGNLRSGAEALCAYMHTRERGALSAAGAYFGVVCMFALGAGLGSVLTRRFGERAIWFSCALLAAACAFMTAPPKERENDGKD